MALKLASFTPAETDKEYIRTMNEEEIEFYNSWEDLLSTYPTPVLANITCTIKFKADTPLGEDLKGNQKWTAALLFSMFTVYDCISISAPSTGVTQKSMLGKKDMMTSRLKKMKITN